MTATPFEVLTMGRVGVDVYPEQVGVGLEEVETFRSYLGGSPTNVAVAAARYGRRSATITKVGADPFGRLVRHAFARYGLDDRYLSEVPGLQTPVTFCEMFPPDRFPIYFYRSGAPDLTIAPEELDLDAIGAADVFWATVTGLSVEPSRSATLAALRARDGNGRTILDLDYRPTLWSSVQEARHHAREAMTHADVVVGNIDEFDMALGARDAKAAAQAALDAGVRLVVVKRGPEGVLALDADGIVDVPVVRVDVVNGLGAGDAFGGALCHGLLAGWPLERTMRFANAAGAIVATQIACSEAMPTSAEVERLLAEATGGR
ncbi:MAG TPA: 5-dehydro-2-deoxygluconokinase [Jiangellaceae bacterium]|nr:5-dehydro-2-deoxygluconokinase [Jiangellaceae bacterium]